MNLIATTNAAQVLGFTERHLRRLASGGEISGAQKLKNRWHIPASYDKRLLALVTGRSRKENMSALDCYSKPKRDAALRKLGTIREFEDFSAMWVRGDGLRSEAMDEFCRMAEIGQSTLKRWVKSWRDEGIEGLVDSRGGELGVKGFTEDAAEMFKSLYLDQRRPSAKTCLQTVCHFNKIHSCGWVLPSLRSIQKWIQKEIPQGVRVLHREGVASYDAKCAPYIQSDPDSFAPGECWIGDHHQLDFWVRHRNRWIRPWLTMWMDYRSRKMTGWVVTDNPNQTTILRAFGKGAKELGLPSKVKIDNGKDYASAMWMGQTKTQRQASKADPNDDQTFTAGLYAMMDISVSFSIPYHPQSKPVERLFHTVDMQFSAQIETYCGKDSARKPDYLNDRLQSSRAIERAHSLESIAELFEDYADVYNQTAHRGEGMNGRSPNEVYNTREAKRVIEPGALALLMQVWSSELKVGKNGVRFSNFNYGQYDPALLNHQGKKVRVAYDPDNITTIQVYDAITMKLLCIAEQNELIALGDKTSEQAMREAQAAKARAKKLVKNYKPAAVVARSGLAELAIDAQRAISSGVDIKDPRNLQFVRTALDGQGDVAIAMKKRLVRSIMGRWTLSWDRQGQLQKR